MVGSPPRVRGKLVDSFDWIIQGRITPARAGKTKRLSKLFNRVGDHPRACGENEDSIRLELEEAGSPPRVRGKRSYCDVRSGVRRITPARAGKTAGGYRQHDRSEDHPRACGENGLVPPTCSTHLGSPPRVRGKPWRIKFSSVLFRITPARAGKTLRKWRISVVDPSPQPRSSLTSRRADASIGSQRAPCAAPV